ncbi:MAG: Asp-tRNA(Asn)/Glu-tRNA(Gln) amidotransferase subunit GatC [Candidatus Lokiarchaeota archaeon]|nr:Asp-tRNA(Asn)/Glu-tRNA(Gln) amidotransferase subunit GatC [Candidatus Lokiarchaeota archaeon]
MTKQEDFSNEELNKLAKLALLDIDEKEKEKLSRQLGDILNYFKKLNDLNTDNVEPTTHALDIKNVYRKDEPIKSLSKKETLANSQYIKDGYFKAPRILKK